MYTMLLLGEFSFKLQNPDRNSILVWKIKSTANNSYVVQPNRGEIQPKASSEIKSM